MTTVQNEYVGKHRLDRADGAVALRCSGWDARDKIRSAMRGVPNESPRHTRPYFDVTEGDWRFIAEDTETAGTARVRITRKGDAVVDVEYPAYKVWNVLAHMPDTIAAFEYQQAEGGDR